MSRRVWTLTRAELKGYFDHPTAYVLAVAFLGITLFLGFRSLYASGLASLRPVFDRLPLLFAVLIPAATMRSLAEERRGRTLEWLLSQPLGEADVVLGKFLGCWLFVLALLAGTLPMAAGVLLASTADPGIVLAQYLGAALLAAQLVALGIAASSLTRNQVTAFILAATLAFLLVLIGMPVAQMGLHPRAAGALAQLSVIGHFENVARGVLDLRDALYFLSTAALFLALAGGALGRERLSRRGPAYRRLRVGLLVAAALVLVLNLLGSHIRGRLDLTRDRLFTLAGGTRALLSGLDDIVHVQLFASRELPPEVQLQLRDVRDLLADMRRAAGGNLVVSEIDPDANPDAAREASGLGIRPLEFNVLRVDEMQVRRGYYGMALVYADDRRAMPVIERTSDLEFRLASAIAGMTARQQPGVAFLAGYGALGPGDIEGLSQSLAGRFTLRSLDLAGDTAGRPIDPDSTRVLVIGGPTAELDGSVVARIRDYVRAGGGALVLLDPVIFDQGAPVALTVRSGLEDWLEEQGVRFVARLVFDLASHERLTLPASGGGSVVLPYPLWPVAVPAGANAVTRGLNAVSMAWAGALEVTDSARALPILRTSKAGGLRDPARPITPDQDWTVPPDQLAERTVAVAIDPGAAGGKDPKSGRLVVIADASFLEEQLLGANPQNLVLLANAIDWLTQDEALIRIRSKDRTPPPLVLVSDTARNALEWGNLLGVPLLFVLLGIFRVTGRRRRARKRWRGAVE